MVRAPTLLATDSICWEKRSCHRLTREQAASQRVARVQACSSCVSDAECDPTAELMSAHPLSCCHHDVKIREQSRHCSGFQVAGCVHICLSNVLNGHVRDAMTNNAQRNFNDEAFM